jgi:AcrR family transcriptional regulator
VASNGLKAPVQQRSRASLERLLRAGARLLAEEGYDGFKIPELSRRARVSTGLIYGRFENKDALVQAIHERVLMRIAEEHPLVDRARPPDDAGLAAAIDRVIAETRAIFDQELRLLSIFFARGSVDPVIREQGAAWIERLRHSIVSALLAHRDEIRHPDPERAAQMCCQIIIANLMRRVTVGDQSEGLRGSLTGDDLATELSLVCRLYLASAAAP